MIKILTITNIKLNGMLKFNLFFALIILFSQILKAQAPEGYYSNAEELSGEKLKTELHEIINNHHSQSYSDLWTDFQTTDDKPDGTVWDMYSDVPEGDPPYIYNFGNDQCGNYSGEGSCYNREHSFPKSWFDDASPMYTDLYHLYPTDGYVNGRRQNYPYGETDNPGWTSKNGSKKGPCSYPGYGGTVFEPIDEYKGDFARTYFYMVTRYEDKVAGWASNSSSADAMLNGTTYPAFEQWAVDMLMDWHQNDPVSDKEINRNNTVFDIQNNRNPFIDHPEYVNEIWGDPQEEYEKPVIDTVTFSPASPEPGEGIAVYATIQSSSPIQTVEMSWGKSSQNYSNQKELSRVNGDYTDSIPGQTDTDSLYVIVEAQNYSDSLAKSKEYVIGYDNNTWISDFKTSTKNANPKVYPNPTKGMLFVKFEQPVEISLMELYDLSGKILQKQELSNIVKQKVLFRIMNVSRGTYILKTQTKENIHYNKVLVK